MAKSKHTTPVVGGVDTHKDLHVAAVVDDNDQVLGTQSFATTRQGYKLMLTWMRSFGDLQRIGVECTGSYGAGLLRYMQVAGVDVLEVTAPDKQDRRRRGKNDVFDAQSAALRGCARSPRAAGMKLWNPFVCSRSAVKLPFKPGGSHCRSSRRQLSVPLTGCVNFCAT